MKKLAMILTALMLLTACTSKNYEKFMNEGEEHLENERYDKAVIAFEKALEEKSLDEAKDLLSLSELMSDSLKAFNKGDFDDAIELLEKVLLSKDDTALWKKVKRVAKDMKEKASRAKNQQEEMEKEIKLGKSLLEQERWDEAEESFKKVAQVEEFTQFEKVDSLIKEAKKLLKETNKGKETQSKPSSNINKGKKEDSKATSPKGDETLTKDSAEQIVKKHLGIQEDSGISVTFDHFADNGDYIVHVYEFILDNPDTNEGHTATIGWYGVNPKTKAVYDAMDS